MTEIPVEAIKELRKRRSTLEADVYIYKCGEKYYAVNEQEDEIPKCRYSLCADCENFSIGCPKVRDGNRKKIENYPFLIKASEVISKDSSACRVIVFECKNFVKDKPREKGGLSKARRKLAYSYFGVENDEELSQVVANRRK